MLYGGYSRVKTTTPVGRQGKGGPQRNILKPIIHQDTWFLRITPPAPDAPPNAPPTVRWERRKRPANPPNPARAGATMAYHKGRGILFGGVHDVEESEEGIDSEFFDALYAWNTDRNRFFQLTLRRPRGPAKKQQSLNQTVRGRNRGKADEEELLRNLAALDAKGSIITAESVEMDIDPALDAEDAQAKIPAPLRFEMPHPRFNSQLAVQDDTLFIFGGTFEKGDLEFTFNDLYSIDLGKLEGVRELFYREPENWNAKMEELSDEENEEDDDDDNDEDSMDEDETSVDAVSTLPTEVSEQIAPKEPEKLPEVEVETEEEQPRDSRPYPRPFESLRDFFSRTTNEWQTTLRESLNEKDSAAAASMSIKEIRKEAFEVAEERWWDCREEIRALEDEQEEAGIGEVISISARGAEAGGAGRRR